MVSWHCFALLATRGDAPFASLRLSGAYSTIILAVLLCKFCLVFYFLGVIVANAALNVCKTSVNAIAVVS